MSGMLIDTNETCIVQGDIELIGYSGLDTCLHILKVMLQSEMVIRVVTSNISDKYLQGILIGYAKDVTAGF